MLTVVLGYKKYLLLRFWVIFLEKNIRVASREVYPRINFLQTFSCWLIFVSNFI